MLSKFLEIGWHCRCLSMRWRLSEAGFDSQERAFILTARVHEVQASANMPPTASVRAPRVPKFD